jgi:hypothetical protein
MAERPQSRGTFVTRGSGGWQHLAARDEPQTDELNVRRVERYRGYCMTKAINAQNEPATPGPG